jgi:hypothetical protein
MKFITTLICSLIMGSLAWAHDDDPNTVVISKATELGVHRIERLVTLKKLDAMFLSSLHALQAQRTGDALNPYKVTAFTLPDGNNQASSIEMITDVNGKVTSYKIGNLYQPANPIPWPTKDSITLMEDGLHFVLDGWVKNKEVKPFYLGLSSITLTDGKDTSGNLLAIVSVTSDDDPGTLVITMKTDGTIVSHAVK